MGEALESSCASLSGVGKQYSQSLFLGVLMPMALRRMCCFLERPDSGS